MPRRTLRRLMFVTDAPLFGGAERYIVAMARAARRRGLRSGLCWWRLDGCDPNVLDPQRLDGLPVHTLGTPTVTPEPHSDRAGHCVSGQPVRGCIPDPRYSSQRPYPHGSDDTVAGSVDAEITRGPCSNVSGDTIAGSAGRVAGHYGAIRRWIGSWRATARRLLDFWKVLRQERPDGLIINGSGKPGYWLLSWVGRLAGLRCVWVHQMIEGRDHRRLRPRRLGGWIEGPQLWRIPQAVRHKLASLAADSVVVLNARDRRRVMRWQNIRRDQIRVVPHGVDSSVFRFNGEARRALRAAWQVDDAADPAPLVVGTAGRLVQGKGMELLIDAAGQLRARGVPVHLVIAGDGPDEAELREQALRAGLGECCRFLGFVADMPGFYSGLDVFALCSATESFGLALAEAMACGRPVVATPTAGARRQILHGETGLLLDSFTADELADALEAMHGEPIGRQAMGRLGQVAVMEQFGIELTLERTLRALRGRAGERSILQWPGMRTAPYAGWTSEDPA